MFGFRSKASKHRPQFDVPVQDQNTSEERMHIGVQREGSHTDVTVSGRCIDTLKADLGRRQTFTINTPESGTVKPGVMVSSPGGMVEVDMETRKNGTFNCQFTPTTEGVHTVMVCYKMMNINGSPFKIDVQKSLDQTAHSHRPPSASSLPTSTPTSKTKRSKQLYSQNSEPNPPPTQCPGTRHRTTLNPVPLRQQDRFHEDPMYHTVEDEDDVAFVDTGVESLEIQNDDPFYPERLPQSPGYHKPRHRSMPANSKQGLGVWDRIPKTLRAKMDKCLKKGAELTLGKELGEGQFGKVCEVRISEPGKGIYTSAAKTISDTRIKQKDLEDFISEALLMYNFRHQNVLELIGVVVEGDLPYILFPIMGEGSLDAYLRKMKGKLEEQTLLSFGRQVAMGMTYISDLKFVHRDLAARNCLLDEHGVVKISDFGLARDNFRCDYVMAVTHKKLPLRWMAPEILTTWTFTTETDVWSYGVLLWEIFAYGTRPYEKMPTEFLVTWLQGNNRLSKPEAAPAEIYELMMKCWKIDPEGRPKFKSIARDIYTYSQDIGELTYGN